MEPLQWHKDTDEEYMDFICFNVLRCTIMLECYYYVTTYVYYQNNHYCIFFDDTDFIHIASFASLIGSSKRSSARTIGPSYDLIRFLFWLQNKRIRDDFLLLSSLLRRWSSLITEIVGIQLIRMIVKIGTCTGSMISTWITLVVRIVRIALIGMIVLVGVAVAGGVWHANRVVVVSVVDSGTVVSLAAPSQRGKTLLILW